MEALLSRGLYPFSPFDGPKSAVPLFFFGDEDKWCAMRTHHLAGLAYPHFFRGGEDRGGEGEDDIYLFALSPFTLFPQIFLMGLNLGRGLRRKLLKRCNPALEIRAGIKD